MPCGGVVSQDISHATPAQLLCLTLGIGEFLERLDRDWDLGEPVLPALARLVTPRPPYPYHPPLWLFCCCTLRLFVSILVLGDLPF